MSDLKGSDAIAPLTPNTGTVAIDHASSESPVPPATYTDLNALSRSIVRKYDLRLIPIVFLAYTVFWLDRANIALARVNGLEQDLKLKGSQFNVSLAVFFAVYIAFNIPSNLVLRRLGGGRWLPALMVTWGIATTCSGFVKNFGGLLASRAVVGLAEAGFMGGVLLWLGFFYTNEEMVVRVGIFLSSTPLAGSLGGLLAGGLAKIDTAGYSRWPWIFFIEGALTVAVGIGAFFVMPDSPNTARFLTVQEKAAARDRMVLLDRYSFVSRIALHEAGSSTDVVTKGQMLDADTQDRLQGATWRRAILHPVTLFMTVGCFLTIEAIYAFNLFIPSLLIEMGFRGVTNALMTVPPNFFAFLYTIGLTQYSQRSGRIAIPLMVSAATASVGYALLLMGSFVGGVGEEGRPIIVKGLQYAGLFLAGAGVSASTPIAMSWVCINANPHYVRAIALGFMIGVGNFAAFIASFTYIKTNAPRYVAGHSINLAFTTALLCIAAFSLIWMRHENNKRARGDRDHRLQPPAGVTRGRHELQLGWDHPRFKFTM